MPIFQRILLIHLCGLLLSGMSLWWLLENDASLAEKIVMTALPWALALFFSTAGTTQSASEPDSISPLQWARRMDAKSYAPNELLIREGDPADGLYILSSGRVQVWKKDEYGARLDVAELVPGSIFGEMGLLRSQPRNANVEATEPTTALFVTKELFSELVQSSRETHKTLETLASERSRS